MTFNIGTCSAYQTLEAEREGFWRNLSVEFRYFFQVDKVLSVAESVKNIGNSLFKNQDWKAAVNKYSKALR